MRSTIEIDIQIDPSCGDPKVVIRTSRMTPEVDRIVHAIESSAQSGFPTVTAYDGDRMLLLSQREIVRVFFENRRLVIQTDRGNFVARKTMADMASLLNAHQFLRISRSEIINLNKVASFDFSLSGTIQVHFDDGSSTWVARRYVRSIQKTLRII